MKFTITLNRAHKIVERLKDEIKKSTAEMNTFSSPVSVRTRNETSKINKISTRSKSFQIAFVQYQELLSASEIVKNCISKGNTEYGVDVLLAKQNRFNSLSKTLKDTIETISFDSCHDVSDLPEKTDDYSNFKLASFNQTEVNDLKSKLKQITVSLANVADQISDANKNTVSFEIVDYIAEMVGLKA